MQISFLVVSSTVPGRLRLSSPTFRRPARRSSQGGTHPGRVLSTGLATAARRPQCLSCSPARPLPPARPRLQEQTLRLAAAASTLCATSVHRPGPPGQLPCRTRCFSLPVHLHLATVLPSSPSEPDATKINRKETRMKESNATRTAAVPPPPPTRPSAPHEKAQRAARTLHRRFHGVIYHHEGPLSDHISDWPSPM